MEDTVFTQFSMDKNYPKIAFEISTWYVGTENAFYPLLAVSIPVFSLTSRVNAFHVLSTATTTHVPERSRGISSWRQPRDRAVGDVVEEAYIAGLTLGEALLSLVSVSAEGHIPRLNSKRVIHTIHTKKLEPCFVLQYLIAPSISDKAEN